jgi:16S rRNA (uracil1498-N3)-methyltransferase
MSQTARFFTEPKTIFRERFLINDPAVCKHLRQVLRIGKGSKIILFDGQGYEYEAEIRFLTKEQVSGVILAKRDIFENWPHVILAQALPKAGKADEIVRMNTEVGVKEFIFFKSEYSVPQKSSYDAKKIERLQRVIAEAGRQSERGFLPKVNPIFDFAEFLDIKADVKIILHSRNTEGSVSLSTIQAKNKKAESFLLAVGPEGGFSKIEIEQAKAHGFYIAYMDTPILRTETAGVVAAGYLIVNSGN